MNFYQGWIVIFISLPIVAVIWAPRGWDIYFHNLGVLTLITVAGLMLASTLRMVDHDKLK